MSSFHSGSPKGNIPVKLCRNVSFDLRKEVVYCFFLLFLALVAILFNRAERLEQLWYRVTQGTFLGNCFKIPPLVVLSSVSIYSLGSHVV